MQRLRVEFRPSANVDIATIFEYIFEASRSSAIAGRFIRRIRDRCERIGDVPSGGRPRDDLAPGLPTVPLKGQPLLPTSSKAAPRFVCQPPGPSLMM
jgi:toxin ParE1/3/4